MKKKSDRVNVTFGINNMVVEIVRERKICKNAISEKALEWDNLSFEFFPLSNSPGTTKVSIHTVSRKEVIELANALINISKNFAN